MDIIEGTSPRGSDRRIKVLRYAFLHKDLSVIDEKDVRASDLMERVLLVMMRHRLMMTCY